MPLKLKLFPKIVRGALVASSLLAFGATVVPAAAQEIPYSAILASPDDFELNLRYARQEVASGRLLQAAAALERILLLKPNWDSVRLFYGVVLYRLDDLAGAVRELELLEGRGLSARQEADRVRYLNLATKRSATLRFSAVYTLGARLDSNPGRSPKDVALTPANDEGSDFGLVGTSRFRAEADIGTGSGDYLFFQSSGYLNEFFEVNSADLFSSQATAGVVLHGPNRIITPYVLYGSTWVEHDRFRQQYGGGVDTSWGLSSQVELMLGARAAYENFEVTNNSTIGSLRDGWKTSVSTGLKIRPTDTQIFKLGGVLSKKDAQFDGYSYDQAFVEASSLTLFEEGWFVKVSASYKRTDFDQPDNFNSNTITREDDRYYARAAVGVPLGSLFGRSGVELPESFSDVVAQIGVSYTYQDSTIQTLNHSNWSGDLLFTKRVNF